MAKFRQTQQTTMRLPLPLKQELAHEALRDGRTVSNLVIFLLREGLERRRGTAGQIIPRKAPSPAPVYLTKQELGRQLFKLMDAKDWTQSELARMAGLTRDDISRYINGKSLPGRQKREALAKALDVTADSLLYVNDRTAAAQKQPSVFD